MGTRLGSGATRGEDPRFTRAKRQAVALLNQRRIARRAKLLIHSREMLLEGLSIACPDRDLGAIAMQRASQEWVLHPGKLAERAVEPALGGTEIAKLCLAQSELL